MNIPDKINTDNLTGELTSVHPQDVFLSMGLNQDPDAMSLTPKVHKYSFGQALEGGASETFGAITKGAIKYAERLSTNDPNYKPLLDPQAQSRGKDFLLAYHDGLSAISSSEDMTKALKSIDDQKTISDAMSEHPVAGFLGQALGAIPEALAVFMPASALVTNASRGLYYGAQALAGGVYGLAATAGEQQTNPTITNQDIAVNTALSTVLAAGLPILFDGLKSPQMKQVVNYMSGKVSKPNLGSEAGYIDYSSLPDVMSQLPDKYNQSVGAASTKLDEFGELDVVPEGLSGRAFVAARKKIAVIAPSQAAQISDSAAMRQWGNETYLSNTTKNKNLEGIASQNNIFTDLEAAVSNQQYRFNTGLTDAMKAEGFDGDANDFMKKALDEMYDNKTTPGASLLRKFGNDYAVRSNNENLLNDVILDENKNYFPNSPSRDKIAGDYQGFKEMTKNKVDIDRQEANSKLEELVKSTVAKEKADLEENPGKVRETGRLLKPGEEKSFDPYKIEDSDAQGKLNYLKQSRYLNPEEKDSLSQIGESLFSKSSSDEVANDVVNKFLNPEGNPKFSGNGGPSEFKKKTIGYTYNEVKKYLPENKVAVVSKYIRDMELKSLIKSRYGVAPNEYVKTINDKVQADYDKLLDKAQTPKEVARLTEAAARDKQQVSDTFDVLAKKYDQPHTAAGLVVNKVSRIVSMVQAMRYLGLSAFANLPDLSNLAGIRNPLWLFKDISKGLENMGRVNLSKEDAEFMHLSMSEMAPTNAAMEIVGADTNGAITENAGKLDKVANVLDKGQRKFFKYSIMNYFVNTERQLAGASYAHKILKAAQALEAGTLEKGTKEFNDLHKFGIDRNNVKEIMDEVRAHGVTKTGTLGNKYLYPNVHNWTPNVGLDFTSKLLREVENTVSSRTVGDAPFWTNKAWGKMFIIFKGWQFGALNRQILPMIQGWGMGKEYKAMILSRILANFVWGNISNTAWNIAAGRPQNNTYDWQHMVYNGFNRGNLFPFLADLSNMADSYGAGFGSALGVNNNSRYYNTDFWGKVSPALGLPSDVIKTGHSLHKMLNGNATGSDYHQALRMLPGTNLPQIGWMVNQLKDNQFGGS